jgi:hypothetical protein
MIVLIMAAIVARRSMIAGRSMIAAIVPVVVVLGVATAMIVAAVVMAAVLIATIIAAIATIVASLLGRDDAISNRFAGAGTGEGCGADKQRGDKNKGHWAFHHWSP